MAWSFDSSVESIVAAERKRSWWLFEVDDTYFWSTKYVPSSVYNSQEYTFKIITESFTDIELNRSRSEQGVQAPSSLSFSIHNKGNVLSASTFTNSTVVLRLIMAEGNGTPEEVMAFSFKVKGTPHDIEQKLFFDCEDILQQYLDGDWPDTALLDSLNPSVEFQQMEDNHCVPEIYGNAYIPVRTIFHTDDRYYVMGVAGPTYTVEEVRSPPNWPKSVWEDNSSSSEVFVQSSQTVDSISYRCVQPIIANGNMGLFRDGTRFADVRLKYSISTTVSMTNPADVIEDVLLSFGVPAGVIDTDSGGSFHSAATTFTTWGLDWSGGFYIKGDRRRILSSLLQMCHSTLLVTDKIELHPISKTSVETITSADILRKNNKRTSFSVNSITPLETDSGYVAWSPSGTPQDNTIKTLVAAKGTTTDYPSADILDFYMVHDSQDVQRLGTLAFQRMYKQENTLSFRSKATLLGLQPEDVVTINGTPYGGPRTAVVDRIRINKNLILDLDFVEYSVALDDFTDLSPSVITPADDDPLFVWDYVYQGPDAEGDDGGLITGFTIGDGDTNIISYDGITAYFAGYTNTTLGLIGGFNVDGNDIGSVYEISADIQELWYRFNESTGFTCTDDSLNGYDGTLDNFDYVSSSSNEAHWVTGVEGNALQFNWDEDRTVIVGTYDLLWDVFTDPDGFAVSFYLRLPDGQWSSGDGLYQAIFSQTVGHIGTVKAGAYARIAYSGHLSVFYYTTKSYTYGSTYGGRWDSVDPVTPDGDTGWMNFIINFDMSDTFHVYVDGVEVDGQDNSFNTLADCDPTAWGSVRTDSQRSDFKVGVYTTKTSGGEFYYLDGQLDGFRIFNRILTAQERNAIYTNPDQHIGVVLNSDDEFIAIGNTVFGARGFQVQYNSGLPRLYVGDGDEHFMKFDGTNLTYTASTAQVTDSLTIGTASAHLFQESDGDLVLDNEDGGIQFWTGLASSSGVAVAISISTAQIATFSAFPILPTSDPTGDYQAAHKKYVDDQVGGTGGGYATYIEDGGVAVDDSASEDLTLNFDGDEFVLASESNGEVSIAIGTIDGGGF